MNRRQRKAKQKRAREHTQGARTTTRIAPTRDQLKKMNKQELSSLAIRFGMDVKSRTRKVDMIDHIMEVTE